MNVHLDTHVLLWLHQGERRRIPARAQQLLRAYRPMISPLVQAELALLHEIGRIPTPAATVVNDLRDHANLGIAESAFHRVAARSAELRWTRDPFDRLIAAHALCDDAPLLSADRNMLAHCPVAVWE